jgi:hypothetical protein
MSYQQHHPLHLFNYQPLNGNGKSLDDVGSSKWTSNSGHDVASSFFMF